MKRAAPKPMSPLPVDTYAPELTPLQLEHWPAFREALIQSRLRVAQILVNGSAEIWESEEMHELEKYFLEDRTTLVANKVRFDLLGKVVAQHRALTNLASPRPRSAQLLKNEANPLRQKGNRPGFAAAARIVKSIEIIVEKESDWGRIPAQDKTEPLRGVPFSRAPILALLSSVTHLLLLHESLLIGLVEALADRRSSRTNFPDWGIVWRLSLAGNGQPDAEMRLLVPDPVTARFLGLAKEGAVRKMFAEGLDPNRTLRDRHRAIRTQIDAGLRRIASEHGVQVSLRQLLYAFETEAYQRIPAVIAAHRTRKVISHGVRPEVIARILRSEPIRHEPDEEECPAVEDTAEDLASVQHEVSGPPGLPPPWYKRIREAFKADNKRAVRKQLQEIVATEKDEAGRVLAMFADYLAAGGGSERRKTGLGTARLYALLLAGRMGSRLNERNPLSLEPDDMGTLFQQICDDDWERSPDDESSTSGRSNQRHTMVSLWHFTRFLEQKTHRADYKVLARELRQTHLRRVDANFITEKEYSDFLSSLGEARGEHDPWLRSMLRLLTTLMYRCGFRRAESLYLRDIDIDDAGYIHVRPYKGRHLKTLNSNRVVPAWALLSKSELGQLRDRLRERRELARRLDPTGKHEEPILLFSAQQTPWQPLSEDLFERLTGYLRRALQDDSLRLHHLRHSCATLLAARLLPGMDAFAELLFSAEEDRTAWRRSGERLRVDLFGSTQVTHLDIQAVAHLLGHGPGISLEHYIHCLDWYKEAP